MRIAHVTHIRFRHQPTHAPRPTPCAQITALICHRPSPTNEAHRFRRLTDRRLSTADEARRLRRAQPPIPKAGSHSHKSRRSNSNSPMPSTPARKFRRGPARPITTLFQPPCLKFNHPILKFNQKSTLRRPFAIAHRLHRAQITALDGASAVACHRGAQITARPGSSNNRTT